VSDKASAGSALGRRAVLFGAAASPVAAALLAAPAAGAAAAEPCLRAASILDFIPVAQHAAIAAGRSRFDYAAAVNEAYQRAGGPIHFPAGVYPIGRSVRLLPAMNNGVFAPGPSFIGDGMGRTVFINMASNGPMFDLDTPVDHARQFGGVLGVRMEGFTVKAGPGVRTVAAIRLRTCYMARLFQLHIDGQNGDGIRIPCINGDNDGSNMVSLEQVRIENCAGWGLDAAGEPGHNETSFLKLSQVFIQGCGTANPAAEPPSGGMRWKGQILNLDQCAFTLNQNVALFIPGAAGLAQSADLRGTTFENNYRRHLLCTGISAFKARNIQFYSADRMPVSIACEFSGEKYTVRYVDIDGAVVRATAGNNRYTAFRFSGPNLEQRSCRIRNAVWENFDYPGQRRFDGVLFDPVQSGGELLVLEPGAVAYRPAQSDSVPLRLRGKGSDSGEWIAGKIPSSGYVAVPNGLKPNTVYHAYIYDRDGATALDLSTIPPRLDNVHNYWVRSDDPSRLFVGRVATDPAGRFQTNGVGWLNPTRIPGPNAGRVDRVWTDASGKLRIRANADPRSDTDGDTVTSMR
jgi:hypothetical protein